MSMQSIFRLAVLGLGLIAIVSGNSDSCFWHTCVNKVRSIVNVCPSGSSYSKTRDCGTPNCFLGVCIYSKEEHMCCPSGSSCSAFDASCNWGAIAGYFKSTNEQIKSAWSALKSGVQEKITTSASFATLSDAELLSLPTDLLAELKSVAGMTTHQLGLIGSKVYNMDSQYLSDFLSDISPEILSQGMAALSAGRNWTAAQVTEFAKRLTMSDAWGIASSWNATQISSLGSMITGMNATMLQSFSDQALASASNLHQLGVSQLGALGQKMYGMSVGSLATMIKGLNGSTLAASISHLTSVDREWASEQVAEFTAKLLSSDVWGNASSWTPQRISSLGSMLAGMHLTYLLAFDEWSFAHATNLVWLGVRTLGKLGPKLVGMNMTTLAMTLNGFNLSALATSMQEITGIDYAWSVKQVFAFSNVLLSEGAWGNATRWTSNQISALGNMLQSLNVSTMLLFEDWSFANASNLVKLGVGQLSRLGQKMYGMNTTTITQMLRGLNLTALAKSIGAITSIDYAWSLNQVLAFQNKLVNESAWGSVPSWTSDNIGSLGTMLTRMNLATVRAFADSALANASSLKKMSAAQLSGLSTKIGGMSPLDFASTLTGVDAHRVHASMLSQCEIVCENDADAEFLRNPTVSNAAKAFEEYADRVKAKSAGAALSYANAFCKGDVGNFTEALAEVKSAAVACTGVGAKNNTARSTFESWSNSQQASLVRRLTEATGLGPLANWSETAVSALCNQYAALSPSNIAEISAKSLVESTANNAIDAALTAAFGPLGGQVASYTLSIAASQIEPETRVAYAKKVADGLGSSASWGCAQVASLRTIASGLDASVLTALPREAVKGFLPNALTAMDSSRVKGFTPEHFVSMTSDVRKRLSGQRLESLGDRQMVAAVCGVTNLTSQVQCPDVVVDLTMSFPSGQTPNESQVIEFFGRQMPTIDRKQVQVLSVLSTDQLPKMAAGRRMKSAGTEVTLRIGTSHDQKKAVESDAQSTAAALVSDRNGNVIQTATGYIVIPTTTTTTTTITTITTTTVQSHNDLVLGELTAGAPPRPEFTVIAMVLFFCLTFSM